MTANEVLKEVSTMRREDWAKIQIGIGELLASQFASSEREDIANALAEAEAEFERGEGLSSEEMRLHFCSH